MKAVVDGRWAKTVPPSPFQRSNRAGEMGQITPPHTLNHSITHSHTQSIYPSLDHRSPGPRLTLAPVLVHTYLLHHTSGLCFNSEMRLRQGPFATHAQQAHGTRGTRAPPRPRPSIPRALASIFASLPRSLGLSCSAVHTTNRVYTHPTQNHTQPYVPACQGQDPVSQSSS